MDITAVTALFSDLSQVELVTWVERGWVIPDTAEIGLEFHEIDVARVRLIHDLRASWISARTRCRWCCRCSTRSMSCAAG